MEIGIVFSKILHVLYFCLLRILSYIFHLSSRSVNLVGNSGVDINFSKWYYTVFAILCQYIILLLYNILIELISSFNSFNTNRKFNKYSYIMFRILYILRVSIAF